MRAHGWPQLDQAACGPALSAAAQRSSLGGGTVLTDIVTQPSMDANQQRVVRRGVKHNFADGSSLRTAPPTSPMRQFWMPVTFASCAKAGESFAVFDEQLTVTRAPAGSACEWLVLGEGGRELHTVVQDGMVTVWAGVGAPTKPLLPPGSLLPPSHYVIHAELVVPDVPVEWGLLVENLLDLAHAPFTHTASLPCPRRSLPSASTAPRVAPRLSCATAHVSVPLRPAVATAVWAWIRASRSRYFHPLGRGRSPRAGACRTW